MSDAVVNEQPEVATTAHAVQPLEEVAPTETAESTVDGEEKPDAETAVENEDNKNGENKNGNMLKTTRQINHRDFKKNRKYDPTTQPVSDDPAKIRAQVCSTIPLPFCTPCDQGVKLLRRVWPKKS